jgi:hypothetical protein
MPWICNRAEVRSIGGCVKIAAPTADQIDGRANHAPFCRHAPRSDGHALDRRGHVVLGSIDPLCERRAMATLLNLQANREPEPGPR